MIPVIFNRLLFQNYKYIINIYCRLEKEVHLFPGDLSHPAQELLAGVVFRDEVLQPSVSLFLGEVIVVAVLQL